MDKSTQPQPQPQQQPVVNTAEIEPPTNPATPTPQTARVDPATIYTAKKSHKKGLAALIVSIIAAVVLAGGGYATYALWYQNPDKVVTDALVGLVGAEASATSGSIKIEMDSGSSSLTSSTVSGMKIDFDMKAKQNTGSGKATLSMTIDDIDISISGEAVSGGDDTVYVRITDLQETLESMFGSMIMSQMPANYLRVIDKIDGNWIKITSDDLADVQSSDEDDSALTCYSEALQSLGDDENVRKEITDAYKSHSFITVDEQLESKDGLLGYVVSLDEAKAQEFGDAIKSSEFVAKAEKCADLTDDTDTDDDSDGPDKVRVVLWVDRWSHDLRGVETELSDDEMKLTADVNVDLSSDITIEVPSEFTTLEELQSDIEDILDDFSSAGIKTMGAV